MNEPKKRIIYSDSSYTDPANFEGYRATLYDEKLNEYYIAVDPTINELHVAVADIFKQYTNRENDKEFGVPDAVKKIQVVLENNPPYIRQPKIDDVSDEQVYSHISECRQQDFFSEREGLEETLGKSKLLVFGSIGRWDGTSIGWDVKSTFEEIIQETMRDCESFEVWDENGHLFVEGIHHDGRNQVEIRMLTDEGYEQYDLAENETSCPAVKREWISSEWLIDHLKRPENSILPRHAEKVFGCPAEEYEEEKQLPDNSLTGEKIQTPRGNFSLTAMTQEQMEAAGYGIHHTSEDGNHLIMGNGMRAFAVAKETIRDTPSLSNEAKDAREASGELGNNAASKAIDGRDMR